MSCNIEIVITVASLQPIYLAWEGRPSTSSSSVPNRHRFRTCSWSNLETSPRSPKKQVAVEHNMEDIYN